MIHPLPEGLYAVSSRGSWLPGAYEDERAARRAYRVDPVELEKLQQSANTRAGGVGGVITNVDLDSLKA